MDGGGFIDVESGAGQVDVKLADARIVFHGAEKLRRRFLKSSLRCEEKGRREKRRMRP